MWGCQGSSLMCFHVPPAGEPRQCPWSGKRLSGHGHRGGGGGGLEWGSLLGQEGLQGTGGIVGKMNQTHSSVFLKSCETDTHILQIPKFKCI